MQWLSRFDLDNGAMDATHREFVALVSRLETCEDREFTGLFRHLFEHTSAHFEQENQWMQASVFPPIFIHCEEHKQVLAWLHEVAVKLEQGDIDAGRRALVELSEWFDTHAQTMDRALAFHMRRAGFVPPHHPEKAA